MRKIEELSVVINDEYKDSAMNFLRYLSNYGFKSLYISNRDSYIINIATINEFKSIFHRKLQKCILDNTLFEFDIEYKDISSTSTSVPKLQEIQLGQRVNNNADDPIDFLTEMYNLHLTTELKKLTIDVLLEHIIHTTVGENNITPFIKHINKRLNKDSDNGTSNANTLRYPQLSTIGINIANDSSQLRAFGKILLNLYHARKVITSPRNNIKCIEVCWPLHMFKKMAQERKKFKPLSGNIHPLYDHKSQTKIGGHWSSTQYTNEITILSIKKLGISYKNTIQWFNRILDNNNYQQWTCDYVKIKYHVDIYDYAQKNGYL